MTELLAVSTPARKEHQTSEAWEIAQISTPKLLTFLLVLLMFQRAQSPVLLASDFPVKTVQLETQGLRGR